MQPGNPTQDEKEDHAEDNPALTIVIERNIRAIVNLHQKADKKRRTQGRIAGFITAFSARMIFVYVHLFWFGLWILLNEM